VHGQRVGSFRADRRLECSTTSLAGAWLVSEVVRMGEIGRRGAHKIWVASADGGLDLWC
jgi:hypothetical protein